MTEFHSSSPLVSHIPDDLTVPQFFLNLDRVTTPCRPPRLEHIPWLIEDETGREIGYHEVPKLPSLN